MIEYSDGGISDLDLRCGSQLQMLGKGLCQDLTRGSENLALGRHFAKRALDTKF